MTGLSNQQKDRFHELDHRIMGHVFAIHNRMGNCHDEEVYRNELHHLIQKDGIGVEAEVPLKISFRAFEKTYFLDLLIEGEHIYELKVLRMLTNGSRGQLTNYQLIAEKPYGKLINLGSPQVEHEFSTSTLTKKDRTNLSMDFTHWNRDMDANETFSSLAQALFSEWGSRLDPRLYSEAMQHHLPNGAEERVDILSDGRHLGTKLVRLARPNIAFKITTSKTPGPLEIQFKKFINHTNLKAMFWINLNKNNIALQTLQPR